MGGMDESSNGRGRSVEKPVMICKQSGIVEEKEKLIESRRGRKEEGEVAGSKGIMPIEIEKLMEVPGSTVKGSKTKMTQTKGE